MPALLDQLAETMVTDTDVPPESNNSQIPAIFTYLGQFIDHDITANTDRDTEISEIGDTTFSPTPRPEVHAKLGNLRDGSLALDSLYGDDTAATPFVEKLTGLMRLPGDKAKMRLGVPDDLGGTSGRPRSPALPDNETDLPRLGQLLGSGDVTPAELNALPAAVEVGLRRRLRHTDPRAGDHRRRPQRREPARRPGARRVSALPQQDRQLAW